MVNDDTVTCHSILLTGQEKRKSAEKTYLPGADGPPPIILTLIVKKKNKFPQYPFLLMIWLYFRFKEHLCLIKLGHLFRDQLKIILVNGKTLPYI